MAHRIERVNSQIRQELSVLLQREIKDPRLSEFVAVTEVITAPDLKTCKVFISSLGSEEQKTKVLAAMASAAGFLRRELAHRMKLRYTPELIFQWDSSIERGDRLMQLMDKVNPDS